MTQESSVTATADPNQPNATVEELRAGMQEAEAGHQK